MILRSLQDPFYSHFVDTGYSTKNYAAKFLKISPKPSIRLEAGRPRDSNLVAQPHLFTDRNRYSVYGHIGVGRHLTFIIGGFLVPLSPNPRGHQIYRTSCQIIAAPVDAIIQTGSVFVFH